MVDRKMERARRIGGIGTVFSLMFFIPVVGWIIGLIGLVLLFLAVQEIVKDSKQEGAEKRLLAAVILDVLSGISLVLIAIIFMVTIHQEASFGWRGSYNNIFQLGFASLALIIPYLLGVISGLLYRDAFQRVEETTDVANFKLAGNLIMWGKILNIVLVGPFVELIGRALLVAAFLQLPDTLQPKE